MAKLFPIFFILFFHKISAQQFCGNKTGEISFKNNVYKIQSLIKPFSIKWMLKGKILKYSEATHNDSVVRLKMPYQYKFDSSHRQVTDGQLTSFDTFVYLARYNKLNKLNNKSENYNRTYIPQYSDTLYYTQVLDSYPRLAGYTFTPDNSKIIYNLIDLKLYSTSFYRRYFYISDYTLNSIDSISSSLLNNRAQGKLIQLASLNNDSVMFVLDTSIFYLDLNTKQITKLVDLKIDNFSLYTFLVNRNSNTYTGLFRSSDSSLNVFRINRKNSKIDTIYNIKRSTHYFNDYSYSSLDGNENLYFIEKTGLDDWWMTKINTLGIRKKYYFNYKNDTLRLRRFSMNCDGYIYIEGVCTKCGYQEENYFYKASSNIDDSININYSICDTLKAIVKYYDGDSLVLNYFHPCTYLTLSIESCDSVVYKNKKYVTTGLYYDSIINSRNGDTFFTLNLTINKSKFDTTKRTACDSFSYQNTTYKNSGFYTFPYKSIQNCDSFQTLNLTINQSKTIALNQFSCTSFKWNDSTYTQSGTYTRLFKTINQCDSIITLNLNIGLNDKINLTQGINYTAQQDSVSYQWFRCNPWRRITNETKKTFTTSTKGSYAVVLDNGKGCKDTSDCIALYSSGFATTSDAMTRIYPNPFTTDLTIELDKLYKKINIKIYDLTGRLILNNDYQNNSTFIINNSTLSKGTYYLQIETENNNQFYNILKD